MLTILRLNWLAYAKALALATLGLLAAGLLTGPAKWAMATAAALPLVWTGTSLVASWWIYDREQIFELRWLGNPPGKWLSLHNGLDDITRTLQSRYPAAEGHSLDIFDPREMTEASILEVRKHMNGTAAVVDWRSLPAHNQSYDTVFLVFAAHELRRAKSRERLFLEVQRVLKDDGHVILVEHLRDANNFAVFGPGAFHFFSKRAWLAATAPAGLVVFDERRLTPFVHVFVFGKQCAR